MSLTGGSCHYLGVLTATLGGLLEQEAWPYEPLPEGGGFRIAISAGAGRWSCVAIVNPPEDRLVIYGVCPFVVPAERRVPMAELITRANFGLPVGNFELDLADGELRCRTSIDFEDAAIDAKLVRNLLYLNVALMARHLPVIEAVLAGTAPLEALAQLRRP